LIDRVIVGVNNLEFYAVAVGDFRCGCGLFGLVIIVSGDESDNYAQFFHAFFRMPTSNGSKQAGDWRDCATASKRLQSSTRNTSMQSKHSHQFFCDESVFRGIDGSADHSQSALGKADRKEFTVIARETTLTKRTNWNWKHSRHTSFAMPPHRSAIAAR